MLSNLPYFDRTKKKPPPVKGGSFTTTNDPKAGEEWRVVAAIGVHRTAERAAL